MKCKLCQCRVSTEEDMMHHLEAHKMYGVNLPSVRTTSGNSVRGIISFYREYCNKGGFKGRQHNLHEMKFGNSLNHVDYEDPSWVSLRNELLVSSGFRCVCCGSKNKPQAHHLIPAANDPQLFLDRENIVIVCRKCHLLIHRGYTSINYDKASEGP